ncbi:PREDICTED: PLASMODESMATA CALLOSE-BINDING PROTEIN 5 [Tarenaya hassleriana]|uniref:PLASMODESMATA CALLOSE-BINDING PROTEIN 5 n=1 Tax=Tarenaya hassleriana TaxID=28532 RepID=UPI00053C2E28|nr:PREDICTED: PLASMODESMATA CALLOSE-BINDING PROTEIN 5 [Tarenaya hassleriana]
MARHLCHCSLVHLLLLVAAGTVAAAQGGGGAVDPSELWCVAKNNAEDAALQTAIDWACGPGGADCGMIQQGGPCYDPMDLQQTASYAFNDYYLKHGLADDACFFDNNAALTSLNPSRGKCKFPSSKMVSNGSVADTASMPGTGQRGFADSSGTSRISSVWVWPFLGSSHLFAMAWKIHHL